VLQKILAVMGCLLLGAPAVAQEAAGGPLKVCMAENNAPFSSRQPGGMAGYDVEITKALAAALQRELVMVPFESKFENESTLTQEVNALLSSGVCELASGFALIAQDLGAPARPVARVPDHPGAKPPRLRPWITLQPLTASDAYQAVVMTLVVKKPDYAQLTLAEPQDARFGAVTGTLGGAALMFYRNGRLRPKIVSLSRGEDLLQWVDDGRIDAALVAHDRLDVWKSRHPGTDLKSTGYNYPLRINLGFVALSSSASLLDKTNAFLREATRSDRLQPWARAGGATFIAPQPPFVTPGPSMFDLMQN
jgi:ABC-type amino acid transport substrate-binding protein